METKARAALRAAEDNLAARQSVVNLAESAYETARAPLRDKVAKAGHIYNELQDAIEAASRSERAAVNAANAGMFQLRETVKRAEEAVSQEEWTDRAPKNTEEFVEMVGARYDLFQIRHGISLTRAPVVRGLTLYAGKSGDWGGAERAYVAVAQDGTLAGWMAVSPARHQGDSNTVRGEVKGKPFLLSRIWRLRDSDTADSDPCQLEVTHCPKPVEQFTLALQGLRLSPDDRFSE